MNNLTIHTAIIFAAVAHRNQVRKGTDIPYIVHPMEVMQILIENKCAEDAIVAGILHDVLEDTQTSPEQVEQNFGANVLKLVQAQSEDKSKTWKERKQHTIDTIKDKNEEIQLICCADKLSNIKSIYADKQIIGDAVFGRFNATIQDIKWYYHSIVKSLNKINSYKMKQELKDYVSEVFKDC